MRVLPTGLAAKLASGVTTLAQAWRLTRTDGLVVAVTQHDRDLGFDGTLFVAGQSFIASASETQVNLALGRSALSGALSIAAITQADLALGRWDQAKIEAFWVDWTEPSNFIPMWSGLVAGASWRGAAFELDIVCQNSVLNREIGRVYARTCDAALGDSRCKVDLSVLGRTFSAAIMSVTTDRSLTIAVPADKARTDFYGGAITLTTGPAASWRSDITRIEANATTWTLFLGRPLPVPPNTGDMVSLVVGCDKSFATCKARFGNGLNFRGQPTLPGDDVAFGGPAISGNDGGRR